MGLTFNLTDDIKSYNGYAKSKHYKAPFFIQAIWCAENPDKRLYLDLQGPFKLSVKNRFLYILAMVDDYLHKGWKAFFKLKSDATAKIINHITRMQALTDIRIKYI